MSLVDWVLSNTVGVAYRAVTGNVDPWTKQQQIDDFNLAIAQAAGPDADPATVAAIQAQGQANMNQILTQNDANPDSADSCTIRLPLVGCVAGGEGIRQDFLKTLEKITYGAIAVMGIGAAVYFASKYRALFKK